MYLLDHGSINNLFIYCRSERIENLVMSDWLLVK